MRTLLKFSFIVAVPVIVAGLPFQNAQAMALTAAASPPPNHSQIEKIACNGTTGPHCGPGFHWVCRPNVSCGCVACLGSGTGYGYGTGYRRWGGYGYGGYGYGYGRAGWAHRGWHHHFWHRGHHGHHGHHGTHNHVHHHFHHHHHGHHGHRGHHGHHHHGHHGHHGGHHRSDIRLKQDIVALARLDNGLELYRFRYKGTDPTVYVGVMAQDVEKLDPRAVSRDSEGYLMVDYDRLGLDFLTWDEWVAKNKPGSSGSASVN